MLTIYLQAPPNDGLRVAQEHFKTYVKPILVASGLDWEFVQGRQQGDIRAAVAERLREDRRSEAEKKSIDVIVATRTKQGVKDWQGPKGDLVIGRHTWKEYVRGLHEGWLGPLVDPATDSVTSPTGSDVDSASVNSDKTSTEPTNEKDTSKPKRSLPYIATESYATAPTPSGLPAVLEPSMPISFPHILGFLNTPLRLYRFFNRRHLADDIGRDTAGFVLGLHRAYSQTPLANMDITAKEDNLEDSLLGNKQNEIEAALVEEEKEWPKNVWKREQSDKSQPEDPDKESGASSHEERTWLDPIVLDPRIAHAMHRTYLGTEDQQRAAEIVVPEAEVEGWIKGGLRSLGTSVWKTVQGTKNES